MILYRVQSFPNGPSWCNTWHVSLAAAKETLALLPEEFEARIDRIDVPTDKAGLCEALNRADANHMNWEGERVK